MLGLHSGWGGSQRHTGQPREFCGRQLPQPLWEDGSRGLLTPHTSSLAARGRTGWVAPSQVPAIGSKVHTHRSHLWYTLCGRDGAFAPSPGDGHLGSSHLFAFVDTADTYVLRRVPADGSRPWSGSPALGRGWATPSPRCRQIACKVIGGS